MKKNIFRIIILILFISIITGCYWKKTGFLSYELVDKFNGAAEQGVKYLEKKYNTNCEYSSLAYASMDNAYDFYAKCDITDKDIYVESKLTDKRGEFDFIDNYNAIKYADEVKEILSTSLEEDIPNATLFYNIDYIRNTKLEKIQNIDSLEDFLNAINIKFVVAIKQSDFLGRDITSTQLIKRYNYLKTIIPNILMKLRVIEDDWFEEFDGTDDSLRKETSHSNYIDTADIYFDSSLNCDYISWKGQLYKDYTCIN